MKEFVGHKVYGFHYSNKGKVEINFDVRKLEWNEEFQFRYLGGVVVDDEMLQCLIVGVLQDENNTPQSFSVYSLSKENIYDYAEDVLTHCYVALQQLDEFKEQIYNRAY